MTRLGTITVGQSPRVDIMPDIEPLLPGVEILERGALDGFTYEELDALAQRRRDPVLATRRRDGQEIIIAEEDVMDGLNAGIDDLNKHDVEAIVLLCTGTFPALRSGVPLLYPEHLLSYFVRGLARSCTVGVMTPAEAQMPFQRKRWGEALGGETRVEVAHASPYASDALKGIEAAAQDLRSLGAEMIVMDCLGYTREMRALARHVSEQSVVLARTVVARAAAELLGI